MQVILVLCTNSGMAQYASAMCAIFPGCTAEGKDIFAVVHRKDDQVLTSSPFGDAINAQGTLDDEDVVTFTRVVLSQPIVKISLNNIGQCWLNHLRLIPEERLPSRVVDHPLPPLLADSLTPPDKLVLMLKTCTKLLCTQIAEQLCNRIPRCTLDGNAVVTLLFQQRKRRGRLVDGPFYQRLQAMEVLFEATDDLSIAGILGMSENDIVPREYLSI
jgi:hypothetical protein